MHKNISPFTVGRLPSLTTVEYWHSLYEEEKKKREQLEREVEALRDVLDSIQGGSHGRARMENRMCVVQADNPG